MNSTMRLGARMFSALGIALVLAGTARADAVTDKLKATLQKRLGADAPIQSITKTPVPGLYEVNFGQQITFVHGLTSVELVFAAQNDVGKRLKLRS